MAKQKKLANISEQLRAIIRKSGQSQARICKGAGVDPSHLCRFMQGSGRMTNDTLDKLGDYLNIKLVSHTAEDE